VLTLRWCGGAVEQDPSARRALEAGDHPQRRRLPAPGRPEQREELARRHVDVDAVHGDDVVESLAELLEADLALHQTSNVATAVASSRPAKRR
jgi:hypothetical protein